LIEKVVLITTPNIGMSTHKPALFDVGERARWRARSVFGVTNGPERGSEVAAMLVDGKCVEQDAEVAA